MNRKSDLIKTISTYTELYKIHKISENKKYMYFLYIQQHPLAENLFELKEIDAFNTFCRNFLIKGVDGKVIGAYISSYNLKTNSQPHFLYIGDDNSDKETFSKYYEDFGGLIVYKGDLSSVFIIPSTVEASLLVTDND